MKVYHEFLEDAVEEADAEGFKGFMVIDKLNWFGNVYNDGHLRMVLKFEPEAIKTIEDNLAKAEGYKNEPFILVTQGKITQAPVMQ